MVRMGLAGSWQIFIHVDGDDAGGGDVEDIVLKINVCIYIYRLALSNVTSCFHMYSRSSVDTGISKNEVREETKMQHNGGRVVHLCNRDLMHVRTGGQFPQPRTELQEAG